MSKKIFKVPEQVHADCKAYVTALFNALTVWEDIEAVVLFGSCITEHFKKTSSDIDFLLVTQADENSVNFNKRLTEILYNCLDVQEYSTDNFVIKDLATLYNPEKKIGLIAHLHETGEYLVVERC